MTSLGDDARETLTIAGLEKAKEPALEQHLRLRAPLTWSVVCKCGSAPANNGGLGQLAHADGNWCRDVHVCLLDTRKRSVDSAMRSAAIVARLVSERWSSSGKSSGKGGTSRGNTDKCYCCGQVGHRRPECPRRNESCSLCGKRGQLSQVCRFSDGNASAWAVEAEPAEPVGVRNSTRVGTVLSHFWTPVGRFVCLRQLRSPDESGNLLNMIMDSGAEEHVVSLADWKSLGEPVLKPAQNFPCAVRLVTTWKFLAVCGAWVVRQSKWWT